MTFGLDRLQEVAAAVVAMARELGADGSEVSVSEGAEFTAQVRLDEVEKVKEAGSSAVGVRVLAGRNTGSSYTSDFSPAGLQTMVRQALDSARITTADPHAGMPDPAELGSIPGDLLLYSEDVVRLETPAKIDMARRAEQAARDYDPRITNSEGAVFTSHVGRHAFANSQGFCGCYQTTSCSLSAVPVARSGDRMERDFWYTLSRSTGGLESPEAVGRKAASLVLRRLNPRKIASCRAPVVFEPRAGQSLVGHIFTAASGDAVYRKASFLAGRLGERVASPAVTVVDDGTLPGMFGTSPFDDEGVPSRRTVVVDRGILASYLLNTYTARKLGLKTTGNASRGITGNPGVGHGNLFMEKGSTGVADLLKLAGSGLYVTELMGFGYNPVTGDYSRSASGLWIENGELAYPVSEVTIAGNMKDILMGIEAVADDLEFRGSVATPTLLVREMTISGS